MRPPQPRSTRPGASLPISGASPNVRRISCRLGDADASTTRLPVESCMRLPNVSLRTGLAPLRNPGRSVEAFGRLTFKLSEDRNVEGVGEDCFDVGPAHLILTWLVSTNEQGSEMSSAEGDSLHCGARSAARSSSIGYGGGRRMHSPAEGRRELVYARSAFRLSQ